MYLNAFVLSIMLNAMLILWVTGAMHVQTLLIQLLAAGGILAAGWLVGALFPSKSARAAAEQARLACLDAGLCPACGYELIPSPPEPDGRTICPECGAAWS